jgi:hypothetical protein
MRLLLDINVIIALLDRGQLMHRAPARSAIGGVVIGVER